MDKHVTIDDLARLRASALEADDVLRVSRHLAVCRDCAAAARRAEDVANIADGFRNALREEEPAEAHARRGTPLRAVAAVAAVAVIGVVVALLRRPAPEPPRPVARAPIHQPAAREADYGRADWNALVKEALENGSLALPADLRDLRPAGSNVRALGSGAAQQLDPAGVVVESDRPRFSWPEVPGAASYAVLVFRGEREVLHSGELKTPTYTPERPLERGPTYQWQVLITKSDGTMEALPSPPLPPALIRVLSSPDAADLAEARRRFPADPLLLGALEARYGLVSAARRDLGTAAQQHPDHPALARLRDSLPETR